MECHTPDRPVMMEAKNQRFPSNFTGYVIMKGFPRDTSTPGGKYMIFCNKFNPSECQSFNPHISGTKTTENLSPNKWPQFYKQMDQKIFETIGGVVYYIFGDSNGWLILFNIEGQTKYCFTAEGEPFSKDVRHKKQLISNNYSEHYFSANHRKT